MYNEFGAIIRKARIDARIKSLGQMADELGISAPFLSGMETGRKKVSREWVEKIEAYFTKKGVRVAGLAQAADVANETVSLEGLDHQHKMMVASFARVRDPEALRELQELLAKVGRH